MKDGTHIVGQLHNNYEQRQYEISNASREITIIPKTKVRRIYQHNNNNHYLENGKYFRNKGFYTDMRVEIDLEDCCSYGLNTKIGYFISPQIALGIGLGYEEFYSDITPEQQKYIFLPVFVHARAYLLDKTLSPYVSFDFGRSISARKDYNDERQVKGSYIFKPSLGLRWATRNRFNYLIEFGYKMQRFSVDKSDFSREIGAFRILSADVLLQRYTLNFGLIF